MHRSVGELYVESRGGGDCKIDVAGAFLTDDQLEVTVGIETLGGVFTPLIERNTKSISLTPLGQEVVEQARQILSRVDALLVSARASREPLAGPLTLGAGDRMGATNHLER